MMLCGNVELLCGTDCDDSRGTTSVFDGLYLQVLFKTAPLQSLHCMYGMSMKLRIIDMSSGESGPCHPAVDSWQVPFRGSPPPLTIPWAMGAHANTEPPSAPMPPSPNSESPSFPAHSMPPVITKMGVQQHGSGSLHGGEVGNFV